MLESASAALARLPDPKVLHTPVDEAPLTWPLISTFRLPKQTTWSVPAFTLETGTIVTVIWSIALSQLFTLLVQVSVPWVASPGATWYTALAALAFGVKEPAPFVVQWPWVALPLMLPASCTVASLAQMLWSGPAL